MAAKFEVEQRGLLNTEQRKSLEDFLKKHGKLIKKYERTQWIFGLSHDKKIDLRIKETNGKREFSLKVGKLDNANRKEISIPFVESSIKEAMEFLKFLGYREGLKAIRNASIYSYKGIEWAIVEVPGHSTYFEAEKLVDSKAAGTKAMAEIEATAKELGLAIFTKDELMSYIRKLDNEANKIFRTT